MSATITQQIKQVQQQLRKQAQRLGELNLSNNDYLQENQKLALQIVELRNKIAKKKHTIEQENKDKMIIHEKLVKAEREKELLEIQYHRKRQQEMAKGKQLEAQEKELERISSELKAVHLQDGYNTVKAGINGNGSSLVKQSNGNTHDQPKLVANQSNHQIQQKPSLTSATKTKSQLKPSQSHANQHYAQQTDRGEYQPPMLFLQTQHTSQKSKSDDESDDDQIDEEMLAKLKAAAEEDDNEEDEEQRC